MPIIFVKPAAGKNVRRPGGGLLPQDGARVEKDAFWSRRIKDGSVVLAAGARKKPEKPEKTEKKTGEPALAGGE